MNSLREKAAAAAKAVSAKASAASDAAMEKARKEAASARAYVESKREEIRPKLKAAMDSAEPSVREFMNSPSVEYLKKNPQTVAALCTVLAFVGIPGAASALSLVNLIGPAEVLLPIVMAMAAPVAEAA